MASRIGQGALLGGLLALAGGVTALPAEAQIFSFLEELDVPTEGIAEEPSLAVLPDGRVMLSWTELSGPTFASVKVAVRDNGGWSDPVTVTEGDEIFVNYADFPSVSALANGTLAINWLQMRGTSYYAYDAKIAFSQDGGQTWGEPIIPYRDDSEQQHGFVSMLPDGPDGLLAMWLDGRDYGTGAADADTIQLRATTLTPDGIVTPDVQLDARTCSCCQTTAVALDDGTILLAYRDRTEDEIRDISMFRRTDGQWSDPVPVSGDGWEIAGCPVNGPAIDASGNRVALVWFTAANDVPAVRVAFSDDRGTSFGAPEIVDFGSPVGGVDVVQLADGSALVSWLERTVAGEALLICRARPDEGCSDPVALAVSPSGHTIGFPRMVASGDDVYVAWNEPSRDAAGQLDGGTIIRAAHGVLAAEP